MKIYREILRNTEMGIESIENILGYVEDDQLKNALLGQKEVLEDFNQKSQTELGKAEKKEAEGTKLQKTMLKAGVHMNAMFNRDTAHIASMLIDGYNMGLTSVQKCVNELTNDGVEVPQLAKDVIAAYDKNIKKLREYL